MSRRRKPALVGWTDYPMTPEERREHEHLSDGQLPVTPWRRCRIVAFNGDKHADVEVEGFGLVEFKIGYVRTHPTWRHGLPVASLHPFRVDRLPRLSGKARILRETP